MYVIIGGIIAWFASGALNGILIMRMFLGSKIERNSMVVPIVGYGYLVFGVIGLLLVFFGKNKWRYIGDGMLVYVGVRILIQLFGLFT